MPKNLLSCVFIIIIFAFSHSTWAGFNVNSSTSQFDIQLNYDSYSVADGLSQNTVSSIVEDQHGYIWIGTVNGLNRFDGNEFKQFHASKANGLPSSFIRNLLIDNDGRLLVGTDKGLVVFDANTEKFHSTIYQDEIGNKPIWSMSKQGNKVLIGINNEAITVKDFVKNDITIIHNEKLKEIKRIISIDEALYIRNFDGMLFKHENSQTELIADKTNDITYINNQLIVSMPSGTYKLNNDSFDKLSNIAFKQFNNLIENDIEKNISVAVNGSTIFRINNDLSVSRIGTTSINLDKSNTIYINSDFDKILATNVEDGFISISTINNLVKRVNPELKNIWSIAKDKDSIYIATNEEFLRKYDKNLILQEIYDIPGTSGPKYIAVRDGNMYIGGHTGLFVKQPKEPILKISNHYITHLKVSKKNTIIAGTFEGDILEVDKNNSIVNKINTNLNYPIYDTLVVNGQQWIASQIGVYIYTDGMTRKVFDQDLAFSLSHFRGRMFFGSTDSLISVNLSNINHISEVFKNNKIIYSISHYQNFLLTASGYEINIISATNKSHIRLNKVNGVLGDYNIRSFLALGENILFGGTSGLSLLNTNEISSALNNNNILETNFKELLLFNSPVKVGSEILTSTLNTQNKLELKYSDYPFSITFNSIGRTSEATDFNYILRGLDEEWIPAKGNNSATYTNLSPGDYTFSIYAIDLLTGQKGTIRDLDITITPPWWLSFEAKLIYGLFACILALMISKSLLSRREVQKQIIQSEERLKLSLWGSGDEMWDWDIETGQIYRSNIWGTLDFPRDGRRCGTEGEKSNIHPIDQERVQKALNDHFTGHTDHFEIAYRVKGRDNQWVWILDRAKIVERDQKENPVRMTGTIKNINKIKQAEEQLRLFARAIENISEGMFILDEKYHFVEVNEACCELSACTREKFKGKIIEFERYPASYSDQIRSILSQQGQWVGEIEANKGDGDFFLMELTIDTIYDEQGQASHYVGVFSDITRRKQQEEELRKLTNNDILTGLPNRSSLQVTLSNLVKKDIHHTLMVLDLDNFKRINDSLGHQIGDDLLIGVADRIRFAIPSHASLYRLGGDEFALLIDQTPDIGSCAAIASQVIQSLATPFEINHDTLVLGISIGIVLYPEDEQNEQALLRKADIAMYHAKSAGGSRYQFYSESLNQNALKQLEIENLIREALKEDYFEVYYQPKVDLKNDCLAGMEALVRLNHPELGIIAPNDFIPLAEENGLIIEIGDVVLRKACFAAEKWLQQGIFNGRIAVNLSSRQFALSDLQVRIESILRLTKLPAQHLELEITEGTVIKNPENAIKVMQQLSKMGINLALDDFGTGYSSLSYLKRFPINCLKIDKSFIDDIDKSDTDLKMVDSIITIAHNMGLSVVAEGVEQTAQLNILKALNCEEIQGYIYSKPIPETEFTLLLKSDADKKRVKMQS